MVKPLEKTLDQPLGAKGALIMSAMEIDESIELDVLRGMRFIV